MLSKEEKRDFDVAFDTYMKNPAWRTEYESAPSQECKDYLKYTYYDSKFFNPEKNADRLSELKAEYESKLSVEDWEYLKSKAGNSPFVGYADRKIKELQK